MESKETLLLKKLGERIKLLRNNLSFSQETLADKAGLDRTYISLVERGKRNPSYLTMLKICKGLNTNISQLTKDLN